MTQNTPTPIATPSIAAIMAEIEKENAESAKKALTGREELMVRCCEMQIKKVVIDFCGSGDSGSVEGVTLTGIDDEHIPYADDNFEDLRDDLREWAYTYLAGTGVDWYNNDGGQGEITWDMSTVPFTFTCYIDQNQTVSETVYTADEAL